MFHFHHEHAALQPLKIIILNFDLSTFDVRFFGMRHWCLLVEALTRNSKLMRCICIWDISSAWGFCPACYMHKNDGFNRVATLIYNDSLKCICKWLTGQTSVGHYIRFAANAKLLLYYMCIQRPVCGSGAHLRLNSRIIIWSSFLDG